MVWLLTGLWHGASWNFALWGLYYGVLLILEKFLLGKRIERIPGFFRRLGTLLLVLIGWVIFRVEDVGALGGVFAEMFTFRTAGTADWFLFNASALQALTVLPVALIACVPVRRLLTARFGEKRWFAGAGRIWALLVWLLSLAMLLGESYNPFIYFRF